MPSELWALAAIVLGTAAGLLAAWLLKPSGIEFALHHDEWRRFSLRRVAIGSAILIPVWGLATALLLLLPPVVALASLFVGVPLFVATEQLYCRWCAVVGGVLMFAGVLAAVVHGVIR